MASDTGKKDARLNFRLPSEIKETIEEAAAHLGQTVSDFAISTLAQTARQVIQDHNITRLSQQDRNRFVALLDDTNLRAQRGFDHGRQKVQGTCLSPSSRHGRSNGSAAATAGLRSTVASRRSMNGSCISPASMSGGISPGPMWRSEKAIHGFSATTPSPIIWSATMLCLRNRPEVCQPSTSRWSC